MTGPIVRALALCALLASTSVFLANARRAEVAVTRTPFDAFPMAFGSWRAVVDPPLDEDVLRVLGVDDYLSRVYYDANHAVGLYMGFYGTQRQGDTIHSPLNCLPGAGWEPVSAGRMTITNVDGRGRDVTVNRVIVQKGIERQLVLYWYQSHGRVVASDYTSKLYLIHDAIRLNRTDGSLVRVISPIAYGATDHGRAAEHIAESFVRTIFPTLDEYLPE